MLDIKFVRDNPDAVKENIRKKFQDAKLPLVDEVIELDASYRACLKEVEALKAARNKLSKANGPLFGQMKKCTDEAKRAELQAQIDSNNAAVKADADKMAQLEAEQEKMAARIQEIMYTIPNMIDPSVPIGPDDSYCRISRSRTTPRSWRALTASIWTPPAVWPATASTTCWATSPACTRRCWPTPVTS